MTTKPADLLCRCGAPLTLDGPCPSCETLTRTDDVGIVRLTQDDDPWPGVPRRVAVQTSAATTDAALVDRIVDAEDGWSADLQERLLHPATGVAATLVPLDDPSTVLDLGTGWGPLAGALALYGPDVHVVRADHVLARLRFNVLMHPAEAPAIHLDLDAPLPWPADAFDAVFVDAAPLARTHGAAARDRVLAEVCRVLRPDGVAVVRTANTLLVGGRNAGRTARLGAKVRAMRDPVGRRHVRRAGLVPRRVVVPYPALDDWRWLVPAEGLRAQLVATSSGRSRPARVRRQLPTRSTALRVVRDAFVIAQPAGSAPAGRVRTLPEELVGASRDRPPVTLSLSDARVAVVGEEEFVKIPLSAHQEEALATEVAKTTTARERTAFAPFVLPGGTVSRRGASEHGLSYTSFPRVHERRPDPAQAFDVVVRALRSLDATNVAPLAETALWRRLTSDRGAADAEEMGVARLRDTVLAECGHVRLPVGPSHGDLHAGNVMFRVDGDPILVDWNRFEEVNPLLLDAAYAAVRAHRVATRTTMAEAFAALADGEISLNLAERARALAGDLDTLYAASVVLLDRVASYSLPRRRYKPWTMGPMLAAGRELQGRMDARTTARPTPSDSVAVQVADGDDPGPPDPSLGAGVAFPDRLDERGRNR